MVGRWENAAIGNYPRSQDALVMGRSRALVLTNLGHQHPAVSDDWEVDVDIVPESHRAFWSQALNDALRARHDAVLVDFLVKVLALRGILGDQRHLGSVLHSLQPQLVETCLELDPLGDLLINCCFDHLCVDAFAVNFKLELF